MSYLIFDLAILAILALFFWRGYARGLVLTLCSLLAVFVALIGASFLSNALAEPVAKAIEPIVTSQIHDTVTSYYQRSPAENTSAEEEDWLAQLPLEELLEPLKESKFLQGFAETFQKAVDDKAADIVTHAAPGAGPLCGGADRPDRDFRRRFLRGAHRLVLSQPRPGSGGKAAGAQHRQRLGRRGGGPCQGRADCVYRCLAPPGQLHPPGGHRGLLPAEILCLRHSAVIFPLNPVFLRGCVHSQFIIWVYYFPKHELFLKGAYLLCSLPCAAVAAKMWR